MFKSKTLKQILFATLMCVSAVLLCFVGVYATENLYKLKTFGKVDPDILCKIQYIVGDTDNPTFTDSTTIIFDNHNGTHTTSGNTQPVATISLGNGTLASRVTFKLTNFTEDKHIRLSIKDTSNNTLVQIPCNKAPEKSSSYQTGTWAISSTGTAGAERSITINIVVEEVHKVTVGGEGLATAGDYYLSANDTIKNIDLKPAVGYQLPQTITTTSDKNTCSSFSVTNNLQGQAEFSEITTDDTLTCNCERVFTIHKNNAPSMTPNSTPDTNLGFLPNNGKYTISNGKYTPSDNFKEYKYFVEMGYYPQTMMTDSINKTTGYAQQGSTDIYTKTVNEKTEYYLYSEINVITNSVGLGTAVDGDYAMFKFEPIVWVVVGAQGVNLDDLHYDATKQMLFTDVACGKPFTGQLELLSAYGLDTSPFDTAEPKYSDSEIHTVLNRQDGGFNQNTQVLNSSKTFFDLGGKHIQQQTVKTFELGDNYALTSKDGNTLFLLGYGQDQVSNEDYKFTTYFDNGVTERNTGYTYSLAVASLSDFAIANGAECGSHTKTDGSYESITDYTVKMGWSSNTSTTNITTTSPHSSKTSCAYWLRTACAAYKSPTAYVINLNGLAVSTLVTDSNICVRPFTVLDMSYYYNKTNSTPQTTQNHKFYPNYTPPAQS